MLLSPLDISLYPLRPSGTLLLHQKSQTFCRPLSVQASIHGLNLPQSPVVYVIPGRRPDPPTQTAPHTNSRFLVTSFYGNTRNHSTITIITYLNLFIESISHHPAHLTFRTTHSQPGKFFQPLAPPRSPMIYSSLTKSPVSCFAPSFHLAPAPLPLLRLLPGGTANLPLTSLYNHSYPHHTYHGRPSRVMLHDLRENVGNPPSLVPLGPHHFVCSARSPTARTAISPPKL